MTLDDTAVYIVNDDYSIRSLLLRSLLLRLLRATVEMVQRGGGISSRVHWPTPSHLPRPERPALR